MTDTTTQPCQRYTSSPTALRTGSSKVREYPCGCQDLWVYRGPRTTKIVGFTMVKCSGKVPR